LTETIQRDRIEDRISGSMIPALVELFPLHDAKYWSVIESLQKLCHTLHDFRMPVEIRITDPDVDQNIGIVVGDRFAFINDSITVLCHDRKPYALRQLISHLSTKLSNHASGRPHSPFEGDGLLESDGHLFEVAYSNRPGKVWMTMRVAGEM
jgi:hypothetical protein